MSNRGKRVKSATELLVTKLVVARTEGSLNRIKADILDRYDLPEEEALVLAGKKLKALRSLETNRICNKLGIYKGRIPKEADLEKMLDRIWDNYEKYVRFKKESGKRKVKASRPAVLRTLGFESYSEYLRSELWLSIREQVLVRDEHKCRVCLQEGSQVHHRSYSKQVLLGEDIQPLITVCEGCYTHIEYTPEGEKRSFLQSSKVCNQVVSVGVSGVKKLSHQEIRDLYPELAESRIRILARASRGAQTKALRALRRNRIAKARNRNARNRGNPQVDQGS